MKKLLFVTSAIIFVIISGQAQEKNVEFGIKAGYTNIFSDIGNFTTAMESNEFSSTTIFSEQNNESGFYIGTFVDIKLLKRFHIQPEILYFRSENQEFFSSAFLAKYFLLKRLSIYTGPQIS